MNNTKSNRWPRFPTNFIQPSTSHLSIYHSVIPTFYNFTFSEAVSNKHYCAGLQPCIYTHRPLQFHRLDCPNNIVWPAYVTLSRVLKVTQVPWRDGWSLSSLSHQQWRTQKFCSGGGSTNSVEGREEKERWSGGGSPLVRGSGGSCNLLQEI